jgi:deoxyribonuclease-4
MTSTVDDACRRVSRGIRHVLENVRNRVGILIENTAGQGTEIGATFFQLNTILKGVGRTGRVGICLDTAHAFAAGYDLSTKEGLGAMVDSVAGSLGLDRVKVLHLNDTRSSCGARVDRHWHIGRGAIGLAGFYNIIHDDAFRRLPGIMETPRKSDADDIRNMQALKQLR